MVVGLSCPKCRTFITKKYPHKFDTPTFLCEDCRLILEAPVGMRRNTIVTELPPEEENESTQTSL